MAEWEAFHYFEPWGAPAEDDRWSIHYMLMHRAHFDHKNETVEWLDRDPEETARIAAKEAAKITLEDQVHALFGPMVKQIEEGPPVA